MPVFTILSATYNHERYLENCILSVLAQTFSDWEMILLDDGSTDHTGEIASQYADRDPRIRYIRQENQGIFKLAVTNNKGLSMARGRYISILEGDDCWEPDKLQRQFEILEANPDVVVCWGRAEALVAETREIQSISPKQGGEDPCWTNRPTGTILNLLYLENMIPAVTITMRKSALDKIGGFKQPAEFPTTDLPTLLNLALAGAFWFDEKVIAQWRVYSRQMTKMYPVQMMNRRWNYVLSHVEGLDPGVRSILNITKAMIDRHFRKRLLVAYATSGRYRLIRGEYREARKDYLRAIFYPLPLQPLWRLRAITGCLFSLFHANVETLSRKLGKVSYK